MFNNTIHPIELEKIKHEIKCLSLSIDDNYNISEIKNKDNISQNNEIINKNLGEVNKFSDTNSINEEFENLYKSIKNDKEYNSSIKEKERNKCLVPYKCINLKINKKFDFFKEFYEDKFNLKEFVDVIKKNNHHKRNNPKFEDDFSSSDSYETEFFKIEKKIKRKFKIKSEKDIIKNIKNLKEIMKVVKLSQI